MDTTTYASVVALPWSIAESNKLAEALTGSVKGSLRFFIWDKGRSCPPSRLIRSFVTLPDSLLRYVAQFLFEEAQNLLVIPLDILLRDPPQVNNRLVFCLDTHCRKGRRFGTTEPPERMKTDKENESKDIDPFNEMLEVMDVEQLIRFRRRLEKIGRKRMVQLLTDEIKKREKTERQENQKRRYDTGG